MSRDDVILGPAKEVLDEKDKIEPRPELEQDQEQEQEQQQQQDQQQRTAGVGPQLTPRRKALRSLGLPQLISLFQEAADSGAWNEEAQVELLELILEKGGQGAVRRALGRLMATADGHASPAEPSSASRDEPGAPAPSLPAGVPESAAEAEELLAAWLGAEFPSALVRRHWPTREGASPDELLLQAAALLHAELSRPAGTEQP